MKKIAGLAIALGLMAAGAAAQQAKPQKPMPPATIARVMEMELRVVETQFVPAAEAMPADKYDFAPTSGNYTGVRTFALEVKHVATVNFIFFSAVLRQPPPAGVTLAGAANGPDDIQTKEQIVKYLKDSFALGHKAMASLTAGNAVTPIKNPPLPLPYFNTRLAVASFACAHSLDHYGQMVEYLRMNGIVPPASQGQPPANPIKK
ncbi:MAG TPA: DinB family protein [Candidatus Acidoferrales bacterium]|nr:DinB family protein [Candidatus Acidoferrales bacterium]